MRTNHIFLLILVTSAVLQILSWSNGHDWGDDFSAYIMQAISFTDGSVQDFVQRNFFAISESSPPPGPVTYPWGFPIMLTPAYLFFGFNLISFKATVLVCFLCFLVVLWLGFKTLLSDKERLLLVSFFAFNPYILSFGDNVLSDIPFLLFSTVSVVLMLSFKPQLSFTGIFQGILLGVSFALAMAIRSNGVLLPLSFIGLVFLACLSLMCPSLLNALKLDKRQFVGWDSQKNVAVWLIIPLASFFTLSLALSLLVSEGHTTYISSFDLVTPRSIASNVFYYSLLIREFFGPKVFGLAFYLISLILVFIGILKKWRESILILIYVLLTLVLFVVWPWKQGLRFIFPILPFYIYFMLVGLRESVSKFSVLSRYVNVIVILSICFLASISFLNVYRNISGSFEIADGPYTKNAKEMFAFIRQNVPNGEVVVFRKCRAMRLFTDRDSVFFRNIADFKYRQWYVIDKKNLEEVDLLKDDLFSTYPVLLVFENSQFQVFKFK